MNNIQYSIVYAVIRPEINEKLSVGLILLNDENTTFRYSENKMRAVKELYSPKEYLFFERMIQNLHKDKSITTRQGISYLNRYSNNLMSVSAVQTVDLPLTSKSADCLFSQYIDRSIRESA